MSEEVLFPGCWKVSLVVPVLQNVGERSTAKNYHPVSLLSVVSKVFEKLVNNRIVGLLEKCGLFSDFQYGFRSSQLYLIELLELLAGLGPLELWHLIYPKKNFDRVCHAGLLHKSSLMESQVNIWPYFFFSQQ